MFHTTNFKPKSMEPCKGECRFTGDISVTDSLCLVCSMTPEEKTEWASLDALERDVLSKIVETRREEMWNMWEYMTEPTLQ